MGKTLCPMCLKDAVIERSYLAHVKYPPYVCTECQEEIPAMYVEDYDRYPPVVMNALGFRGHGKTVFFASLFYYLKRMGLAKLWAGFYTQALSEESIRHVYSNMERLAKGLLPEATPTHNFPRPTLVRVHGIPEMSNMTLVFYDVGGETFNDTRLIQEYADFIRHSPSLLLLASITECQEGSQQLHDLLNRCIIGLREMGSDTRRKSLIVVYTKSDLMLDRMNGRFSMLGDYLRAEGFNELRNVSPYVGRMQEVSDLLCSWTCEILGTEEFVNLAQSHFASVTFCAVSALGSKPQEGRMPVNVLPRRVLDPLLWVVKGCSTKK
jgi:hypothetical protein